MPKAGRPKSIRSVLRRQRKQDLIIWLAKAKFFELARLTDKGLLVDSLLAHPEAIPENIRSLASPVVHSLELDRVQHSSPTSQANQPLSQTGPVSVPRQGMKGEYRCPCFICARRKLNQSEDHALCPLARPSLRERKPGRRFWRRPTRYARSAVIINATRCTSFLHAAS